jgi:hypothetical protein
VIVSMPAAALDGTNRPARGKIVFATAIVALTLIATWKFIDYRTQPPPAEEVISNQ